MAAINLSKIAAGTGSLEITAHGMADASALDMAGGRGITTSIVFIDSRLEDCETLVADVSADSEWLLVDSDSDGLAQMQAALAGRSHLASIRILAHGRPGALLLGASELTHDEVDHHAVSLAMIGRALDAQGDVQIYGCEVGQGDTGCAFVDALAEAIGAPVAASSSPMGHAELGGGWWLDVGEARSPVLDRPQWRGLLGVTITPLAPSYPGRSAGEVRNGYAFAAVRADGSVVTWGHSTNGGNSSAVTAGLDGTIDVTQVFSTMFAFAALRANGSVVTWGNSTNGGDSSAVAAALDGTIDVTQLFSAQNAFAALRSDGSVVTWGYAPWGGDSSAVATAIDGTVAVTQVFSTTRAFAALRADGSVVAWGYDPGNGHGAASDTSTVAAALDGTIDVINVFSNSYAFSALRADGSVVSWGQDIYGGDQSDFGGVTAALDGTIDVTQVACTSTAFAALRADGSVVTWGQTDNSTLSPTNVTQLFSTAGAFAALRADGSVVTWGGSGGDSSAVATALNGTIDVTQVFSTMSAFAALRADGSVVTWGDDTYGGNSNAVAAALNGTIDVTQVFSTTTAFAALRADGSVVTWGFASSGGDSSSVAAALDGTIDVTEVFSTETAFAALRADGSVVTWGYGVDGGDSSAVASQLTNVVSMANPYTNDVFLAIPPIVGTAAADVLNGTAGDDILNGLAGDDTIHGGTGHDLLNGDDDNDQLYGDDGNDTLNGGDGADFIMGGTGVDAIDGGTGLDTVSYEDAAAGIVIDLASGSASNNGEGQVESVLNVENVHGTNFNDVIQLSASSGYVFARAGNDSITGGIGNDRFFAGSGNDTINGGAGTDIADYLDDGYDGLGAGTQGVTVDLGNGTATDNWGASDQLSGIESVNGSSMADDLTGNGVANALFGNDGNDSLNGGAGDDTLNGGDGADFIMGGTGVDAIDGGTGLDTVSYEDAAAGIVIDLASGSASNNGEGQVESVLNVENVHGTNFNDVIQLSASSGYVFARAGNDSITGGIGNDRFFAGSGNDTINGGAGTDIADYLDDGYDGLGAGTQGVTVDLGNGTATDNWGASDQLSGIESVNGSSMADDLIGNDVANALFGNDGNDSLNGGAGDDTLNGGDGADFIMGGTGVDAIDGGTGLDTVSYEDAAAGIVIDLASGSASNNGEGQVESVLNVENVHGTNFNDVIQLSASSGYVFARAGNDSITGGIGNDRFFAGSGNDTINGGAGTDIADYLDDGYDGLGAGTQGVTVDLGNGTATDNWGASDQLSGIESVNGSSMADDLIGNDVANALFGNDGNDSLNGGAGDDTLNGGDGADFIMGGTGVDAIDGGTGLDTVSYEDAAAGIVIDLASGSASNNGEGQVESVLNVENVHGTNFNDVIQLSASSGYVFARAGNDSITGGIGNDRFFAGSGNDTINGGAGTDIADYLDDGYDGLGAGTQGVTVDLGNGTATDNWGASDQLSGIESVNGSSMADDLIGNDVANALFGNDGNDSLNGGAGDDTLNGGDGADFIMGGTGVDAIDGGTGLDTVSYEDAAAGIVIDLASGSASNNGEGQVESVLNVENVHGTNFNDVIQLSASSGYVFARAGNDSITGGIGNDRFFAGSGNDTINGGAGTDIADYLDDGYDGLGAGTQGVTVDLGNGTATDNWGASDQLSGIESVNGSSMADDLIGNDVANALFGNDGNDSLNGGGGADTMIGGDGSDYYYVDDAGDIVVETNADLASGGNDLVYSYLYSYTLTDNVERLRLLTTGSSFATGNSLDNTLYAGDGNNVMNGGTGNDTVSYAYATSAVSVNLALGNAQATGGSGIDTLKNVENLTGSNYNDWLRGDSGNNVLEGGDGNDSLNGEAGADTLIGGDGTDYYYVENAGDVVIESNADLATGGNDLVYSYLYSYTLTDNVERLRLLTPGSSFATGNSLDNTLYAGDGNNVMDGGTGIDTVSYAYAKSAISVNLALGNAQATGGSGIDTLKNIENLAGSNFNDWLRGDGSNNVLEGNDGNDSLNGEAGADTLIGGNGTDYYYVDDAGDLVIESNADLATGGNDLVYSYIYSYTLTDNVERLRLLTTGSSFATGNGLDNLLYAGDGNNVMDGAGGNDTVSYAYATSGVSVNLAIGKAQATGGSGTDTLKNVENLVGSNFNDDLRGDTAANQLDGGNGNDSLNGSAGADTMVGGDGTDYYYVDDAGDVVVESNANPASGGNDLVYSYVYSYTLTDNVERLRILNPGSCFATGNSLDNTLYAGDGNNVMNGAGGNDTVSYAYATSGVDVSLATGKAQVTGGSGTDTLKNVENLAGSRFGDYLGGNNAANELAGGNGNDTLNGGLGNDTLIGGAGSDTIRFDTLLDALNNNDTITDFNVVADRIELENAIFASLTSTGTLAAGSFHSGVGVSATDADDFILYDSSSGALSYDADGNGAGAAVQFATLASGLALSSADFLVT